jgi:hypothetical protein
MHCQGINTLWVSVGAALPCHLGATWSPDTLTDCVRPCALVSALSLPLAPPDRPPRLA